MHVLRRGQLLTECAALDGSGTPQCFVHGLSMVQECATAHDPVAPDPLPSLFAAGQVPPSSKLLQVIGNKSHDTLLCVSPLLDSAHLSAATCPAFFLSFSH